MKGGRGENDEGCQRDVPPRSPSCELAGIDNEECLHMAVCMGAKTLAFLTSSASRPRFDTTADDDKREEHQLNTLHGS